LRQLRTLRDLRIALEKKGIEFLFIDGQAVGICFEEPER